MADENQNDITALTVQLLSAFVSKNTVSSEGLADLIKTTRAALNESPEVAVEPTLPEYVPAVSIRKSLSSREHILSLIDGKPYKTLKRHLATHGLTDKEYRERYNLPASYPMVAPSYSDARRAVAEKLGLGRKPATGAKTPAAPAAMPAPSSPSAPKSAADKSRTKKPAAKSDAPKPSQLAAADTPSDAVTKGMASKVSAPKAASSKAKAVSPGSRQKLSIAAPKDEKASSAKSDQPATGGATPKKAGKVAAKPKTSAAAPKAAPKSKSFKAALEAAGSHLGGGDKAPE